MEILNQKQKIILIGIIVVIVFIIGYYIMQKTGKHEEFSADEFVQKTDNIVTNEQTTKIIMIHITGAVVHEGIIEMKENARISDVIEEAGGLKEEADLKEVNLAYQVKDGQKIYIPSIYDKETLEEGVMRNASYNRNEWRRCCSRWI